ncbi:hypothetical protein D3C71_1321710 [compost metagenome]
MGCAVVARHRPQWTPASGATRTDRRAPGCRHDCAGDCRAPGHQSAGTGVQWRRRQHDGGHRHRQYPARCNHHEPRLVRHGVRLCRSAEHRPGCRSRHVLFFQRRLAAIDLHHEPDQCHRPDSRPAGPRHRSVQRTGCQSAHRCRRREHVAVLQRRAGARPAPCQRLPVGPDHEQPDPGQPVSRGRRRHDVRFALRTGPATPQWLTKPQHSADRWRFEKRGVAADRRRHHEYPRDLHGTKRGRGPGCGDPGGLVRIPGNRERTQPGGLVRALRETRPGQ